MTDVDAEQSVPPDVELVQSGRGRKPLVSGLNAASCAAR